MKTTGRDEFERLAAECPVVPVIRTITADTDTPVSVYLKVARGGGGGQATTEHTSRDDSAWSFLLESVEGGTRWGRYSLVGCSPLFVVEVRGRETLIRRGAGGDPGGIALGCTATIGDGVSTGDRWVGAGDQRDDDPLVIIRDVLRAHRMPQLPHLPRFAGGLVGYVGYGAAGLFERVPVSPSAVHDGAASRAEIGCAQVSAPAPDILLFAPRTVVVFDNLSMTMTLVSLAMPAACAEAYEASLDELDRLEDLLAAPLPAERPRRDDGGGRHLLRPHVRRERFEAMVATAREEIHAGEAIQVVLSHALSAETDMDPLAAYRALRRLNPSPYLFYLELGGVTLAGASPEVMVRVEDGRATLRPIAGTRPRGADPATDAALESELLGDAKERAEHVMLVDLARNDLGRVARPGGVAVEEPFAVERYSHVMHLVSTVSAELRDEVDLLDVLAATFPAGTVSGAPKVRAMEIIASLEREARGPYAGAVGYLGFGGTMDTCIAIRTLIFHAGRVRVQAGAGVVADSDPPSEYLETLHKCGTLFAALEAAGGPVLPPGGPEVPEAFGPGGAAVPVAAGHACAGLVPLMTRAEVISCS